ncbi:MAG: aminotransferase class I/II-fold pyridoxal phosphate-dependent enzyme [Betaproteobacteria bacterium]|nr:aminotransferase class I/II-fold pyridoxal phosphate-dependent enzyme [Betaproteobacteria bacterium]
MPFHRSSRAPFSSRAATRPTSASWPRWPIASPPCSPTGWTTRASSTARCFREPASIATLTATSRCWSGSSPPRRPARRLIATDAVFSMDGDLAPLPELLALAERFDAWLVVDDAHGIGVLGRGRGSLAHFGIASERIVYMATLGKALGGYGAFVAGAPEVIEWLMQRARPYAVSRPPGRPPPPRRWRRWPSSRPSRERLERLRTLADFPRRREGRESPALAGRHPAGHRRRSRAARGLCSARLRERGHLVPAIRPPTVPVGTSRLRISLSSEHSAARGSPRSCAISPRLLADRDAAPSTKFGRGSDLVSCTDGRCTAAPGIRGLHRLAARFAFTSSTCPATATRADSLSPISDRSLRRSPPPCRRQRGAAGRSAATWRWRSAECRPARHPRPGRSAWHRASS